MNNSVFGKSIENIRKRQNIHLVDNRKKALKLSSHPNFDRCTIFDSNLIAVHMKKAEVYFNKPVYVCLLYTSPSPRDQRGSRMPSSA